jgi:hypothetical protein
MFLITKLKYSVKKSGVILAAGIFVIWIANAVILKFTNINFSNTIYPYTVSVPAFFCFIIVARPNSFKVLFSFLTVCNFGMLSSFIGIISFFFTGSFEVRILFELLCMMLITILILKVCRTPYFNIMDILENGWGYLCAVPFLLSIIIYLFLYYPTPINNRPKDIPFTILIFVLMFVFYTIVYLNFKNITQYYQLKRDKEFVLMQTGFQKKEYDAIMDKVDAIQIYRHDMRHHINAINTFLNDNNITEARKYLGRLNDNLSETVIEKYCDNYGVNVILSTYIKKAKDQHINVTCQLQFPENIEIDNIELGIVFSNTIENAIIACKKIEKPADRKISIVCRKHYRQIYIQISNTFSGEVIFDGDYPVSCREGHGFGTRSIAAIAEKYGGVFSFATEGNLFITTVILSS